MAKTEDLRAHWDDGQLEALADLPMNRDRAREAMRSALQGPRQETISRRALDLMNAESAHAARIADFPEGRYAALADLYHPDLPRRIQAMETVDGLDLWTGPLVVGSLYVPVSGVRCKVSGVVTIKDGSLAALAAAIAEREETIGLEISGTWAEADFRDHLLLAGNEDDAAAALAVAAGRVLAGKELSRAAGHDRFPEESYALGAAAFAFGGEGRLAGLAERALEEMHARFEHVRIDSWREDTARQARADLLSAEAGDHRGFERLSARALSGLYRKDGAFTGRLEALASKRTAEQSSERERLMRLMVRLRLNRRVLTSSPDSQSQILGAAGLGAAFGFAVGWRDEPGADDGTASLESAFGHEAPELRDQVIFLIDGVEPLEFPAEAAEALLHLSVDAVPERLDRIAFDQRTGSGLREKCLRLAVAVKAAAKGLIGRKRSFAHLAGFPSRATPIGHPADGRRVAWAVPQGWPSRVRAEEGSRRAIVARPVADDAGALVGYAAFDPWSTEIHGRGRYAFYGLAGKRVGRLDRDEGGFRIFLKEPPGGFAAAPEEISIT